MWIWICAIGHLTDADACTNASGGGRPNVRGLPAGKRTARGIEGRTRSKLEPRTQAKKRREEKSAHLLQDGVRAHAHALGLHALLQRGEEGRDGGFGEAVAGGLARSYLGRKKKGREGGTEQKVREEKRRQEKRRAGEAAKRTRKKHARSEHQHAPRALLRRGQREERREPVEHRGEERGDTGEDVQPPREAHHGLPGGQHASCRAEEGGGGRELTAQMSRFTKSTATPAPAGKSAMRLRAASAFAAAAGEAGEGAGGSCGEGAGHARMRRSVSGWCASGSANACAREG